MLVKIRLQKSQKSFLLPEILLENFLGLFLEFGLLEEEINKIHVFMYFNDKIPAAGYYWGRKKNKHFIQLDPDLLNDKKDELNPTIIHELRHLYWNVVEPGSIPSPREDHGLLLGRYPKRVRRHKDQEENDCTKTEKLYSHIGLLEPFYIDQVLDDFFNPLRQLSLPFFTL